MTEFQESMRQVTPTEWQQRAAQQLLDEWLSAGRKAGIKDKVTIMTAAANLVAYLLCQCDNLLAVEEQMDAFADNVREIVMSHYLEKY